MVYFFRSVLSILAKVYSDTGKMSEKKSEIEGEDGRDLISL